MFKFPSRLLRVTLPALLLLAAAAPLLADDAGAAQTPAVLAGTAAQEAPASVGDPLQSQELPNMTPAPIQRACFWAWYEEYVKDYEVCRTYDSCWNQWTGSCPNGWDFRNQEIYYCCR
ncbi:MAG: hypothetical protein U0002_07445 [Thermoanaerobaculia bacterium]